MWDKIRRLLPQGDSEPAGPSRFEQHQIAAAALLVEAARLDGRFDQTERNHLEAVLRDRFNLPAADVAALIGIAEQTAADSVEWQSFTRTVKDAFDYEGRVAVIEMLWEIAYADGTLHDYEASLLRRVAGLIYVSDRESGEARKRVLARLGQADP